MIDRQRTPHMDRHGQRIRIGAVTYLNSKPLIEGLSALCPFADLVLDYPSRLADDLARGRLDVALIPSVEAFSDPDYEVVSDACVSTRGEVFSVKLYCRVHPGEIKTLALDEGSRTSAALTKVMLEERFGVTPKLQSLPLGQSTASCTADAVLLIGDRAMLPPQEDFHTVWDLGDEWVRWTGLPFVFAMWVARKDCALQSVPTQLSAARDAGLLHVEEISKRGSEQLHLPYDMVYRYLTRNLHFKLGPAERAGLRLFQELAASHGLAGATPLSFRGEAEEPVRPLLVTADATSLA
ncbi:menaquinone biosynthetic enzyme MqnA/MqnD family protein [Planctomicrobium piriforme]|uniref:Chorismate dehydratase n=1 Tax=Planctomicrobium piriforme TaxID=1576369 RepID=A0A1I3S6I1_9PLAN|nr:menaquinone biosynthesis protein [Planctomicrobium piriforme]SFJ54433.1 chorismate dehydratase [Planctomicrobium piriforme]